MNAKIQPRQILTRENIDSFLMLTIGAILAAFSLEEFLVPNHIFDGGVVGISMILTHFLPISLGLCVILLNLPFLIFGFLKMGHIFIAKVSYSIILFSIMTEVFKPMQNATYEILLAVTFGGVLLGAGVGLVLRGGGCLDGTEIIAVHLNRTTSLSTGQVILAFNFLIYATAGIVFGFDQGMYSLLMYFITSKVIDIVETGSESAKSVMIITDQGKELAARIHQELGRTVTFLHGEGYVSKDEKDILYCVVTRAEIFDLKHIISETKGSSFTTVSEVSEIVGNHIKSV